VGALNEGLLDRHEAVGGGLGEGLRDQYSGGGLLSRRPGLSLGSCLDILH
jgi:hypothetical protein